MYYFKSFFLFIALFFSSEASACPMFNPLTTDDKKQAHAVFIGKAVAYETSTPPTPATITFQITEIISGHEYLDDSITVHWINGTFGEPETLEGFRRQYGLKTKTGILFPGNFPEQCNMVESVNGLGENLGMRELCQSDFIGSSKSANAWVLNKYCSGPYMESVLDYTSRGFLHFPANYPN